MQNALNAILSYLPERIRLPLEPQAEAVAPTIHEVTLRADRPLCVYCADRIFLLTADGRLTDSLNGSFDGIQPVGLTNAELQEVFLKLCRYSVYAHQEELCRGYLTAPGGLRIGVCGTAVVRDGTVIGMGRITTLSCRVPREVIGCSKTLLSMMDPLSGALICGPPCSGKTTLIRDMARALSTRYRVSVADERGELAASGEDGFGCDMGLCDVLVGMPKGEAILCAVRTMAPDIVVCDELGSADDVACVRYALRCGAACIATVHAASLDDLRSRPVMRELLGAGAFRYLVFLSGRRSSGRISRIVEWSAADA